MAAVAVSQLPNELVALAESFDDGADPWSGKIAFIHLLYAYISVSW